MKLITTVFIAIACLVAIEAMPVDDEFNGGSQDNNGFPNSGYADLHLPYGDDMLVARNDGIHGNVLPGDHNDGDSDYIEYSYGDDMLVAGHN